MLRRAAELISNLNTTTVQPAFVDGEMSPRILIVRTQENWSYESLVDSMISKVRRITPQKKTNSRKKELKRRFFAQGTKPKGRKFNVLQKLLMKQRARLHTQMGFLGPTLRVHTQG